MIRERTIFLQEKKIEDKFRRIEKDIPDLWDRLFKIYEHYKKRLEEDNPDLERCRKEVIEYIGTNKCICNVASRVKESDSLIVKIVNRIYANNRSAYAAISEDNYYKIITDLVAFG